MINLTKYRSSCLRMLFKTVALKNLEMFEENTGGRGLQIFWKICLTSTKQPRKYINSVLHKLANNWHFILPESFPNSSVTKTLSHQFLLFQNYFIGRIFSEQKFYIHGICFWKFWSHIASLKPTKIIETGSIAKICFAKLNFSSDIFVYLAVTSSSCTIRNKKVKQHGFVT